MLHTHFDTVATITGVLGDQYVIGTPEHDTVRYQYATCSFEEKNRMSPQLIVQPKYKDNTVLVLKYAKSNKIAVTTRTGGYQYPGESSTPAYNVQLNLKDTFNGDGDLKVFEKEGRALVYMSVSWGLGDSNFCRSTRYSSPTDSAPVSTSDHVQTGGYEQLGRSFGLIGDYFISLEVIDHEGESKEVTQKGDPDLFYALLGGSPGNLGVITHLTMEVKRDSDYQGSRGQRSLHLYEPEMMRGLLDILVEMSDSEDLGRNFDCCISVVSEPNNITDWVPNVNELIKRHHAEFSGHYNSTSGPA